MKNITIEKFWEKFLNKNNDIVVHCKTQEEATQFCEMMHKHGLGWNPEIYREYNYFWNTHKENTCYGNIGDFVSYNHCNKYYDYYTIYEYSDIFNQNKEETSQQSDTQEDLRELVFQPHVELTTRYDNTYICINDKLAYSKYGSEINKHLYDCNLCCNANYLFNITKATLNGEVIFDREEYEANNVDWSKVEVDAKIFVRNHCENEWKRRHFAKYENGKVYGFSDGCTSWTDNNVNDIIDWKYAKLAK